MPPRAFLLLPAFLSFACPPLQAALEFEAGRPISTPACGSDRVLPTDLDGDGDLDLVARVENHSSVIWYENTGKGKFRQAGSWEDIARGTISDVADFDGDGLPDLLIERPGDQQATYGKIFAWIVFGEGLTGFGPREQDLGHFLSNVGSLVRDVDSSGLPDILNQGGVTLDPGDGSPEHVAAEGGEVPAAHPGPQGVWTDFTGDGLPDFYGPGATAWAENLGGGRFVYRPIVYPETGELPWASQLVRDERLPGGRGVVVQYRDFDDGRISRLILCSLDDEGNMAELASVPAGRPGEYWVVGDYFPQPGGELLLSVHHSPTSDSLYESDVRHEVARLSIGARRGKFSLTLKTLLTGVPHHITTVLRADLNRDKRKDLLVACDSVNGGPHGEHLVWHTGSANG